MMVQMDQAGGHGGGRSNLDKTLKKLNDGARNAIPGVTILFLEQPSRSPDVNALDLGMRPSFWNGLSFLLI